MSTRLPFGRSIAAVIGIDAYANGIPVLRTAAGDARRLADILERDHGYETIRALDGDASLERLTALFAKELPARLGPGDRALIYFAGHGVALDGDEGPNGYLIPQDARQGDPSSWLLMPAVHDALLALDCRHLLLVLDCCFAGAFRWSSTRNIRRAPGIIHRERFDRFVHDPAWQVITSASYDQKALDQLSAGALGTRGSRHSDGAHSPFAAALFDALAGAGDVVPPPDGDGVMTATELYVFLEDRLQPPTIEQGNRQTPGLWPLRRHDKGEYVFLIPGREPDLPPAPPLTYENNPYRGLASYDRRHADLFFGRDTVIEALRTRVAAQPLTVVLGASGTGKSSVVKAGLVPALEREDSGAWRVLRTVRPGTHPVASILRALQHLDPASDDIAAPVDDALARVDRWRGENPQRHLVLVVDQFEEMVTLCASPAERAQALDLLASLMERNPSIRIVLTLRTDFEPQFADSPLRALWTRGRYTVPPLSQADLRQIIERPASERVLYFEPASLVDDLIDEVVQMPGALPLLSFALSEMYVRYVNRRSDDRALTRDDYEALGGVVGALRHRADEEYQSLDAAHRETMRRIMLRLVSSEGGTIVRRWALVSELEYDEQAAPGENERVRRVLDRLVEGRLLVRDVETIGGTSVEPAHDALVSAWDRLLGWIHEAERAGPPLAWRERLGRAAAEWSEAERSERGGLLWQDPARSAQLNQLLRRKADWLNARERAFARRSVRRRRVAIATAAAVTLAIAAGGVASGIFGLAAKREGERARVAGDSARVAGERAQIEARRVQANAVGAWARTEPDALVRALLLAELHAQNLPAPVGGEELAIRTLTALDSLRPSHLAYGWDWADGLPPMNRSALMRPELLFVGYPTLEPGRGPFRYEGAPEAAAFAPGRSEAAAVFADHIVQYERRELGRHGARVNRLLFSDDGRWIVTASDDGTARVWSVEPDRAPIVLDAKDGAVTDVAISADGSRVATAHTSGTARAWRLDGDSARELSRFAGSASARSIALTPDGATLATGDAAGRVTVGSAVDGAVRLELRHDAAVDALALTSDGSGVIALSGGGLYFWRADERATPLTVRLDNVPVPRDGLPMSERTVEVNIGTLYTGPVRPRVRIEAGGARVLVVSGTDGRMLRVPLVLPARSAGSVAEPGSEVNGDSARAAAAGAATAGAWRVTLVEGGAEVRTATGGGARTFRPDERVGDFDTPVMRAELATDGSAVAVVETTEHDMRWVVGVWRLDDGAKLGEWVGAGALTCVALAPRAAAVVLCPTEVTPDILPRDPVLHALDGSGRQTPIPRPRQVKPPPPDAILHNAFARGAAFSPDGAWVVSWGDFTDAVLLRADGTGNPIHLPPLARGVMAAAFSPDGRRIVRTTEDGTRHIDALGWDDLAAALRSRTVACLSAAQRVQYLAESDSIARTQWRDCEVRFGRDRTRGPDRN